MTRTPFAVLLATGLLWASPAPAELPLAPPPRQVHPDGSRNPLPSPEVGKKEDPLQIVERIIKNSQAVGDKLARTDTGIDTRKTQEQILKDIDSLLNPDDPPPTPPDQNPDMKDEPKDDNKTDDKKDPQSDNKTDDKKDPQNDNKTGPKNDNKTTNTTKPKDPHQPPEQQQNPDKQQPPEQNMPSGGMNGNAGGSGTEPPPMPMPMPMHGGGDQPRERRPRQVARQPTEKEPGRQPQDAGKPGGGGKQQKAEQPKGGKPTDPKAGSLPDPDARSKSPPSRPQLPTEDDLVKDVWGHLPDKLRQQATQYYQQQFMPRYAELLKQYYSTLSEKK
jgi:hypothetical protein